MSDTDFKIIFDKLDRFEDRLKKLEKDVQEMKPSYQPSTLEEIQKRWDEITQPDYITGKIPCMFDTLMPEQRRQPLGLVCRCPKCSPYCISVGSLSDAGTNQVWMNPRTTLDAIGGDDSKVSFETIQQWRVATDKEDYEE